MCFGPSTLGAGAKTRLESRIKKFTPHCVCRAGRAKGLKGQVVLTYTLNVKVVLLVAAIMSAHSKTPYITPSMDFYSGNRVVRGRRGQQLKFALPAARSGWRILGRRLRPGKAHLSLNLPCLQLVLLAGNFKNKLDVRPVA